MFQKLEVSATVRQTMLRNNINYITNSKLKQQIRPESGKPPADISTARGLAAQRVHRYDPLPAL
jgi:hypothetical protein